MIIDKNGLLTETHDANCWENSRYSVWWEGIIFVEGFLSGKTSVEHFIEKIDKNGIESSCEILFGSFSCIVCDKEKEKYYAFVDNSRRCCFFYDQSYVSLSFLKLIEKLGITLDNIDYRCLVEFVITGNVFTKNVFFKNINIINANEILVVSDGVISVVKKALRNIYRAESSQSSFFDKMRKIAWSLQNNRISMDLTGGCDTRLLVAIFKDAGMDFETAISGVGGHPDVEISKKAAKMLGCEHHVTYHKVNEIDVERELEETFACCDGLSDVLSHHRLYQFDKERKERGINLAIGGSGGELYKRDGGGFRTAMKTQLRYRWDKAIVKKLVYSGIAGWNFSPRLPCFLFGEKSMKICANYKEYLYEYLLRNFYYPNKFKMADKIYYEYTVISPRGILIGGLKRYHPLLDRQVVVFGINMQKTSRFLYSYQKNIVTDINKDVARLETTKVGTSLSSEKNYIVDDVKKLLMHKITQKLGKRSAQISNNNVNLIKLVKKMNKTNFYINILKEIDLINHSLSNKDIPERYLGRLITLGKLVERLN